MLYKQIKYLYEILNFISATISKKTFRLVLWQISFERKQNQKLCFFNKKKKKTYNLIKNA